MARFVSTLPPPTATLGRTTVAPGLPAAEGDPYELVALEKLPFHERALSFAFRTFRKSIAVILLLATWEVLPRLGVVNPVFLPPFSKVLAAWWTILQNGQLQTDFDASLYRILVGFGLAIVIAVPLGLLIAWYKPVQEFVNPVLEIFRNTPSLALLPVLVLILGIGQTSKIVLVVFSSTWPILLNTISGVRNVDPLLIKAARSMGLPPLRMFQKVVLPAAIPTIFTGIRLAGSHAVLVIIAAELVGANSGLGFLVTYAQQNFMIPTMYAAVITISALGLVFNKVLVGIERYVCRWQPRATS
jgi:NitT/TauT family transport system permease protein